MACLPGVNPKGSAEEKLVQVSSLLPLESVNLVRLLTECLHTVCSIFPLPPSPPPPKVRSVGALLKYVDKKRLGVELEDEGVRVPILAVKHFSL